MFENSVIVSVVAKDNVVVRSSCRLWGDDPKVVTKEVSVPDSHRYEVKVLWGVAAVIGDMIKAGVSGVIVVSDKILPRLLQAKKMTGRHNAADIMMLPWMKADGIADEYYRVFVELLKALRKAANKDIKVRFIDSLSLFKVRVSGGAAIPDGMIVDIRQGVSDIWGCTVNNDRFFGSVKILKMNDGEVWGEIIPGSLAGGAVVFNERGRIAVSAAASTLRDVTGAKASGSKLISEKVQGQA